MLAVGPVLRDVYVRTARGARAGAERVGLLDRLDRRYRSHPSGPAGHLRTLFAIHDVDDLVGLDTPWWTYPAVREVERHLAALGGTARVFEFGSGASTVWLARRSGEVHSVEHHSGFATVMRRVLQDADLTGRAHLLEVPAETSDTPTTVSGRRGEDTVDYTRYARSIGDVGGQFDLVVVDGRARMACLAAAVPHLAPGGIVVVDDSQRPRYRAGLAASGLAVRRLWGWVPSLPYPRETSVLSRA